MTRDANQSKDTSPLNDPKKNPLLDAFKEATVEERVWLFFKQNRKLLANVLVIVLVGLALFSGMKYYKQHEMKEMQALYLKALEQNELGEFVNKHPNNPLGALAMLHLGDEAYLKEDYTTAENWYKKAQSELADDLIKGRVRLGLAMVTVLKGNEQEGKKLLEQLSSDAKQYSAYRAEAAYQLALLYLKDGKTTFAIKQLQAISTIPNASVWERRAMALKKLIGEPAA